MFLFADEFLYLFARLRLASAVGVMGSGKTSLAFALAHHFLEHEVVLGVWANIPHTLPTRYHLKHTFFILDEAAEHADARNSQKEWTGYGSYLRKLKSFLFTASVNEVDKRIKQIRVQRVMSFDLLGHLAWIYQYQLYDDKTKGWFVWLHPDEYWGVFDTEIIPSADAGMGVAFNSIRPEVMPKLTKEAYAMIREVVYENEEDTPEQDFYSFLTRNKFYSQDS
ncbi:MAG TPA: hypothetical protein VFD70_24490 [Anaerolineae bacterium]|nr:hypothetical protein [Anaerolineae bacterium]